jgi:hypothetical protein
MLRARTPVTASARHSKASPRWGTPNGYVEMARVALGGRIELDPMSEPLFNEVVRAERIYTEQDDCFTQSWRCETMLINPAGGLVVQAWRRLVKGYLEGEIKHAVWIGFSVEQLNLLADEPQHPDDFSKLTCRQRIDFLTPHPMRRAIEISPLGARLECGHVVTVKLRAKATGVRCTSCIAEPEPNGAPSHSNYVVGIGIDPDLFESAFAGRGRISHGRLAASRLAA